MNEQTMCAAIFAGGASRRMGTNKALLPWRGTTLVQYLAGALDFFPERLLSAQQPLELLGPAWTSVPDLTPGCGPLGALESVLSCMRSDAVLCAACDLPFFTRELARQMAQAFQPDRACLVCRDETGRVHPVCAIYHRSVLPLVTAQMRTQDYRMMRLLSHLPVDYFPVHSAQMQNANTPEIWQNIQKASL